MSLGIAITGTGLMDGTPGSEGYSIDPNRLRRMDRFGRLGFLAGSLALQEADSTIARDPKRDPARSGIVFGTAFGCRDSVTDHALLVASTTRPEELRPALFAQTVHNAVNGELAIAWGLGGVSEVIVSGRCAGLEALLMAALFLREASADRIVAGGGEGLHEAMGRAWAEERLRYGDAASSIELQESAAAVVLSPRAFAGDHWPRLEDGIFFFEPDPRDAAERLADWTQALDTAAVRHEHRELCVASVALEPEFLPTLRRVLGDAPWILRPRATAKRRELFGASGPVGAVESVRRIKEGLAGAALVVVRDPEGPTAAVWLVAGETA
jgi:Beta-ketoacyl synthase, N-terminal domain